MPGRSVTTTWVPPNFRGFDDEVTTDSQLLVLQSYFFNRRLVTTLGLRFDQIETFGPGSVRDPVTQIWRRATPNDTQFIVDQLRAKLGMQVITVGGMTAVIVPRPWCRRISRSRSTSANVNLR